MQHEVPPARRQIDAIWPMILEAARPIRHASTDAAVPPAYKPRSGYTQGARWLVAAHDGYQRHEAWGATPELAEELFLRNLTRHAATLRRVTESRRSGRGGGVTPVRIRHHSGQPIAAVTVRQPWASLIAPGPGLKGVECRDWVPSLDPGSLLAIHAAAWDRRKELLHWRKARSLYDLRRSHMPAIPLLDGVPEGDSALLEYARAHGARGAVVSVARYLGAMASPVVVGGVPDPWFIARFGWYLDGVRVLGRPVPQRGRLGLWSLTDEALEDVSRQLGGSAA